MRPPFSSAQQTARTPTQLAASPSPAAQRPQLPAAHACDEDGEEPLQRLLGHAHLARVKLRVRVRARARVKLRVRVRARARDSVKG